MADEQMSSRTLTFSNRVGIPASQALRVKNVTQVLLCQYMYVIKKSSHSLVIVMPYIFPIDSLTSTASHWAIYLLSQSLGSYYRQGQLSLEEQWIV